MTVVDASAIIDGLLDTPLRGDAVARELQNAEVLQTLDFAHLEVISALRRHAALGALSEQRAREALSDLESAPLVRYPASPLTQRIWELRENHTPYDAAYVALAEALDMPLLTTDHRLARSGGHRARIVMAE